MRMSSDEKVKMSDNGLRIGEEICYKVDQLSLC